MDIRAHAVLLAASLAACSGNASVGPGPAPASTPVSQPAPDPVSPPGPVAEPMPEPVVEDRSADPAGTDADGNGIRDDIDRLIADRYAASPALRHVAEQKARAMRQLLLATTREEALRAGEQIARASSCVFKVLPFAQPGAVTTREAMSRDIEGLTTNTRERLRLYLAANNLAGGGYFSQPPEPVCD